MPQFAINESYLPLFQQPKRYNHLCGGRGAGRSYAAAQYFIIKASLPTYFRGIMARQHFNDIRGSQFQQIIDILDAYDLTDLFKIRENTMHLTCKATGNTIMAKGFRASSGNAQAKMKSLTEATDVWIEEAIEVGYDDFKKLDNSLRSKKADGLHIVFTYNKDDEQHWLKTKFHDVERDDTLYIETTYLNNLDNLAESYVKALERLIQTDPDMAKVDVFGQWGGAVKGRIYDYTVSPPPEQYKAHCYGLDFGFTNDPTALVKIYHAGDSLYWEQLIYDYGLTNQDIYDRCMELGINRNDYIYCDSSAPKDIEALRRLGLNTKPAVKGQGSINTGINLVKQYKLHLHGKDIVSEARKYRWGTDNNGNPINKPHDSYNHGMDAGRYGTVGLLGKPVSVGDGALANPTPRRW